MSREQAEDTIQNVNEEVYPFYMVKNRTSHNRRRSSLQSWQQRHRVQIIRRLVRKSGKSSIHTKTTTERSFRFILDIFNTLIEGTWFTILLIVSMIFFTSWFMFAGFWAVISIENVDNFNGTSDTCLEGINSFAGYFLFSIETQTTIGYGGRYINEYCIEAIVGLCIQLLFGVGVCGSLICIVFVKMGGPLHSRNSMVCFSRKAVICQRDGELSLIFRVRDYDMRYECHTRIAAYVAERGVEGPTLKELKLEPPGILIWPLDVRHRIDATSPFWDISAKDLITKRLEVIVVLEGESVTTSYMSRTVTSYLCREIKWGYKFKPCIYWDKKCNTYIVDHKVFNKTEEVEMPLCSGQRLSEVYHDIVSPVPSNSGSLFSSSKVSSPLTMSPITANTKEFASNYVTEEEEVLNMGDENDNETGIQYLSQVNSDISDSESRDSSGDEEYTFMDLSLGDLTIKENRSPKVQLRKKDDQDRPKTLSGTAKEFLSNLQKYVTEATTRNKNRTSRKYEEADF